MAGLVAQHARLQSGHGIEQRHGRDLAARQHEVAEADLVGDARVDEALVDAFVASADQHRTFARRPALDRLVAQRLADGREQHHRCRCAAGRQRGIEAGRQGLGHHHHAGPAAERAVVHALVVALGEIARIPQHDLDLLGLVGAARHAAGHEGREQFGKKREDVEAHARAARVRNRVASRP
ncbi:hypothetical protein D3C72_1123670 [compost metagenome]